MKRIKGYRRNAIFGSHPPIGRDFGQRSRFCRLGCPCLTAGPFRNAGMNRVHCSRWQTLRKTNPLAFHWMNSASQSRHRISWVQSTSCACHWQESKTFSKPTSPPVGLQNPVFPSGITVLLHSITTRHIHRCYWSGSLTSR